MEGLKHPYLLDVSSLPVQDTEVFTNCYKLQITFEYHSLDLHTDIKLKTIRNQFFYSEDEIIEFLQQIVSALAFLQAKGIVHGGVNKYSIVIDQTKKKTCFKLLPPIGLKGLDNFQQVQSLGTSAKGIYISPKQLAILKNRHIIKEGSIVNSYKSDVFALGCIVLGMLRNVESDGLFDYIKNEFESKGLEIIFNGLSRKLEKFPFLLNMMKWMLELNDEQRCDFIELEKLIKVATMPKQMNYNKENKEISVCHPFQKFSFTGHLSSKQLTDENLEDEMPKSLSTSLSKQSFVSVHKEKLKETPRKSQIAPIHETIALAPLQESRTIGSSHMQDSSMIKSRFINPQVLQILNDLHLQNNTIPQPVSRSCENIHEIPVQIVEVPTGVLMNVEESYPDGGKYHGQTLNNRKNGKGKYIYPDGSVFEGEWNNDQMQGFGTLYYSNKCLAYFGDWKNSKFHGKGAFYNKTPGLIKDFDGKNFNLIGEGWNKYEGDFINDNKEGKGELSLMNGDVYVGEFSDNMVHGRGVYKKENGVEINGEWSYGIFQENVGFSEGLEKDVEACLKLLSNKSL